MSPYTVRSLLVHVRVMCNIALESGYLRASPFRRGTMSKLVRVGKPQGKRHLSRADIRKLLDRLAAEVAIAKGWKLWKLRRLQGLVALVVYTGLRRGEALHLHVADVDLAARMIHVRSRASHRLKTERSAAMVPMPAALVPYLETWLAWRSVAPPGFKMPAEAEIPWMFPNCRRRGPWMDGTKGDKPLCMLKALALRAGIGDVNWQMLRRSLSTHLRHPLRRVPRADQPDPPPLRGG